MTTLTSEQKKNNIIATVINFFLPGLGQILLQNKTKKGLLFLVTAVICLITCVGSPITFVCWIWAMLDSAFYDWSDINVDTTIGE